MKTIQIIQADRVTPQPWRNGGGQTRELLAWPNAADWTLRISRADIEANGPFSAFAGVQRWFVVLSGAGVVLHLPAAAGTDPASLHAVPANAAAPESAASASGSGTQDHFLRPGHAPFSFDGGLAPGCTLIDGPTQDFNLMARAGVAIVRPVQAGLGWSEAFAMRGLYSACAGKWRCGPQSQTIHAHTLLWLPEASAEAMHFDSDPHFPLSAWWLGYTPETSA